MHYYKLSEGVFIDYGCNGIFPIKGGILLPDKANCCDMTDEYKKDLHAFLTKWFGGVDVVEGVCVRVSGPMTYGSTEGVASVNPS